MGNCFSDVQGDKYAVGAPSPHGGGLVASDSPGREAAAAAALVNGTASYSTWVEVRVSASNLPKKDVASKSDPMACLYEVLPSGGEKELGRTEVIAGNHNPTFTIPFKVLYNFEKIQSLRLLLVDIDENQDPKTINPTRCDFLGDIKFEMARLVTAKDSKLTMPLTTRTSHKSQVTISAEQLSNARDVITCQISATGLRNVEVLSKSDPYLEINKLQQGDGAASWLPVYKTEVRSNNLNPAWNPITVRATALNNGDTYRPLLLKVLDWEQNGKPRLIGQIETSTNKLESSCQSQTPLPLVLPGPQTTHVQCGSVHVKTWQVTSQPSFLDYIQAGTEISFTVAVDFTASNKPPSDPTSLHWAPPGQYTQYEAALSGVGRVLEFYDSDRLFPAFGFGGTRGNSPVSHCFPLNDRPDALCNGVGGIMEAYRHALSTWRLSGPTLFAPIINTACAIAAQQTPHLRYNVLLILTDGEIMDMPETIQAIVNASSLPLSILVVGIGHANFDNMEQLDGDKVRLKSGGRVAERDIVQFVEFRKFSGPNSGDALAAELLAELPGQFLEYTRARKIPLPAGAPAPSVPNV